MTTETNQSWALGELRKLFPEKRDAALAALTEAEKTVLLGAKWRPTISELVLTLPPGKMESRFIALGLIDKTACLTGVGKAVYISLGGLEGVVDERNRERDERILEAAGHIVRTRGLLALTREAVANKAGLSPAGVSNYGRHRISNGEHEPISYRTRILRGLMDVALAATPPDYHMLRVGLVDGVLRADDLTADVRRAMGV